MSLKDSEFVRQKRRVEKRVWNSPASDCGVVSDASKVADTIFNATFQQILQVCEPFLSEK